MKRNTLILLTLVPVVTGYILNLTLLIPGLGILLYTNLVTAKFALLFEAEKNTISQTSATAMQILGFLLMVIIFMLGYVLGKVKSKQKIKISI